MDIKKKTKIIEKIWLMPSIRNRRNMISNKGDKNNPTGSAEIPIRTAAKIHSAAIFLLEYFAMTNIINIAAMTSP